MADSRRLLLGEIVGVFGVQGALKLRSHTDPIDAIFRYRPWQIVLRGIEHSLPRPKGRIQGKGLLLQLPDVDSRDAAEAWVGAQIFVERDLLPALPPGEFYWSDLEGLDVVSIDGRALGQVSHLFSTGANDVVVVHGERERLIPFVQPDVVRVVDLKARRIVVDWDPDF